MVDTDEKTTNGDFQFLKATKQSQSEADLKHGKEPGWMINKTVPLES
jgi:hypothetical protein